MLKWALVFLVSTSVFADCQDLYDVRHQSVSAINEAVKCYESQLSSSDRAVKANAYAHLGYLKFTHAEFFLELKLDMLFDAFTTAEKGLLLYGAKYNAETYATLPASEQEIVAFAYYVYGLSVSRYVDLKGKLEAIKRMEDIKKSMTTIIRMKQEPSAFGGALRTLAIFHMKVPSIAGGQISLSLPYIEKAIAVSTFRGTLSRYPANNLARAEILFKLNRANEGCAELKSLGVLTEQDIRAMDNGFELETQSDLEKARALSLQRNCR